jgi:integrase/recombinase XerD
MYAPRFHGGVSVASFQLGGVGTLRGWDRAAKVIRDALPRIWLWWRRGARFGKSREKPVRHDLEGVLFDYLDDAGLSAAPKDAALFPAAIRKTDQLTARAIRANDVCRMMKRRLKDAGLPANLSRIPSVTTIADLPEQGVPREDVQRLAGHADPRTTRIYDHRDKKITRNVVERISV